jgi:hypothetical protein
MEQLNSTLIAANINVAKFIKNDKLAIGTASNGIIFFDMNDSG